MTSRAEGARQWGGPRREGLRSAREGRGRGRPLFLTYAEQVLYYFFSTEGDGGGGQVSRHLVLRRAA